MCAWLANSNVLLFCFVLRIFIRVYLNQTDDICQEARSQMLQSNCFYKLVSKSCKIILCGSEPLFYIASLLLIDNCVFPTFATINAVMNVFVGAEVHLDAIHFLF